MQAVNQGAWGTATAKHDRACIPFILAENTVASGIVGDGMSDGRGDSLLTSVFNTSVSIVEIGTLGIAYLKRHVFKALAHMLGLFLF